MATVSPRRSGVRNLIEWLLVLAVALGIALVVRTYVLAHFRVEGSSMATTLRTGDRVFVNKLSYVLGDPSRGDVVVLHESLSEDDLIKRVIGLPGETVSITGCEVYINGMRLDEPYLSEDVRDDTRWCEFGPIEVPSDEYLVFGDNRPFSLDGRTFGPVAEDDIVGRAFVVVWPLGDARWL